MVIITLLDSIKPTNRGNFFRIIIIIIRWGENNTWFSGMLNTDSTSNFVSKQAFIAFLSTHGEKVIIGWVYSMSSM